MYSKLNKNQEIKTRKSQQSPDKFYNSQEDIRNIQRMHNLSEGGIQLLDLFMILAEKHETLYPSQENLGEMCGGLRREYVNKLIAKFSAWGWIIKTYRPKKTCIYEIGSYLKDPGTAIRFKKKFKTFLYFTRRLALYAALGAQGGSEFTQYNNIRNITYTETTFQEYTFNLTTQTPSPQPYRSTTTDHESRVCWDDLFKKRENVMKHDTTPAYITALMRKYNFDGNEIAQLEHVPQNVIEYACGVFDQADRGKLIAPFRYFCGIIKNYKERPYKQTTHKRVYETSTGPKNIYQEPEEKVYTPLQIAKGIAAFKNPEALSNMARLMGAETAVKYRNRALYHWINHKMEYTEDEANRIALEYIKQERERLIKENPHDLYDSGPTTTIQSQDVSRNTLDELPPETV